MSGASTKKKEFYRTVVEVEILSRGPYDPDTLEEVSHDITKGDCSGSWAIKTSEEVPEEEMAELLVEQGSDPAFLFGMDEDDEQ